MKEELLDIFYLLTSELNSTENKRLFQIYNDKSGRSIKPCRCASKISMIKLFLSDYLKQNNFINV